MTDSATAGDGGKGRDLTRTIARRATALSFADLPTDVVDVVGQCLKDWFAVTIAGTHEEPVQILADELPATADDAGQTLVGRGSRAGLLDAALINGAASHALDFDDVNLAMNGHPTVPVAAAVLALAELTGASGREVIAAFAAGYETECRIGRLVGDAHYRAGFHATATLGSFGAAAACARLLGLDAEATATALGIAGTQAAGLKSMFGSMCKPLHAGRAAANGLLAARLAARGFTSRTDVLECAQGFAATHGNACRPKAALADPTGGFHLRHNLFKYHAACYLTHSTIDALQGLRRDAGIAPDDVEAVTVQVDAGHLEVCAIAQPRTGLETKFSLQHAAAFALCGDDTARLDTYSDGNAARADLVRLGGKVDIEPSDRPGTWARVEVTLHDGRRLRAAADVGVPAVDLAAQGARIDAKFTALVQPHLGPTGATELSAAIDDLAQAPDIRTMLALSAAGRA